MRKRTQARECALQILYQIDVGKFSADEALQDYFEGHEEPEVIKEFAKALVLGASSKTQDIDKMISDSAENWTMARMAVVDRNILRLAAYEMLFTPEVPAKVCINEAVELAKKYGDKDSGKFVNGVLDRIFRERAKDNEKS